jgi:hypothetical protein
MSRPLFVGRSDMKTHSFLSGNPDTGSSKCKDFPRDRATEPLPTGLAPASLPARAEQFVRNVARPCCQTVCVFLITKFKAALYCSNYMPRTHESFYRSYVDMIYITWLATGIYAANFMDPFHSLYGVCLETV